MSAVQASRWLALAGYFGIALVLGLWYGLARPAPLALLLLLPLLFPLRGLWRGTPYTYAWSSFLSLFYFTHGVVEGWTNPATRPWAWLEIAASVAFYVGAILYARLRGRQLKSRAAGA